MVVLDLFSGAGGLSEGAGDPAHGKSRRARHPSGSPVGRHARGEGAVPRLLLADANLRSRRRTARRRVAG